MFKHFLRSTPDYLSIFFNFNLIYFYLESYYKMKISGFYLTGFIVSIITTLLALIALGIGFFSPPVSGPFCPGNCIDYPYTEILSRFPRDYYWMYIAILLNLAFVALITLIYVSTEISRKHFSKIALSFAIISATILIVDYFIQITVIQPSLLKGETEGISILTQYNPHGIFIALEEIGYLIMSFSVLILVPVFSKANRLGRAIRITFSLCLILILISFLAITIKYGINREYRFEVAAITIVWLSLIVAGVLLSIYFRKMQHTDVNGK